MTVPSGRGSGGGERGIQDDDAELSTEQHFDEREVPTWMEQLTVRAFVVSFVLGFFLNFIVMKLSLTTGIIPSLNVSAGLLAFFFVKSWMKILDKAGIAQKPFTRQENALIQACTVACSSMAFSGGFGSNILAMSEKVSKNYSEANDPKNVKNPSIGWIMAFLFIISFIGLFCVVPLRKIMILGYKLTYPTGSATALLINSFHTPQGAMLARMQVSLLFKSFAASFVWSLFKWFYEAGKGCGFGSFPTFGIKAFQNRFYFDFSGTYVGVGMMCPHIVNISLLFGSIISWGFMWPYLRTKKGDWYPANIPANSLHGLSGYQVFIGIALVLGDGLFHFFTVMFQTLYDIHLKRQQQKQGLRPSTEIPAVSFDDRRRIRVFLKDQIPSRVVIGGYCAFAAISITLVPHIFPQLRSYHIATAYLIAPVLAFCNAYGCGLTDWSLAANYGKLAIFIFGSWVGVDNGGVLAGLAACGIMLSVVSTAADIMQDFKTGYMTLTSPRSMIISQAIGMAMGCVISPCIFLMFYRAFLVDDKNTEYQAPYAQIYRGIALVGSKGLGSLPTNCANFCVVAFLVGIGINMVKEVGKFMGWGMADYVPNPMGMAVPFYAGAAFTIDMCVGGVIMWVWGKTSKRQALVFGPAVASGMICGEGLWTLPASLLSLWRVSPPMCMKFLSAEVNERVDLFLSKGRG